MELIQIILPVIIIGFIVTMIHIPLGNEVLKRGIIFIDLAIAQIAGLGVVFAKVFFHHSEVFEQIFAFLFAIMAAWFFMQISKKLKSIQEAIIGSTYIVSSSLALLILSNDVHGAEQAHNMFAGQILWTSWREITLCFIIYCFITLVWYFKSEFARKYFYYIFAVTITISVQIIGVYLVFALLIIPAIGSINSNKPIFRAYLISILSFIFGAILSVVFDLPTGLFIVFTLAVFSIFSFVKKFKSL